MKDKRILSRFGIVILVLLALVLIFPSAKIDLASGIKASTQASIRVEHIQNFARSAEMDVQLLSADDPAYQQIATCSPALPASSGSTSSIPPTATNTRWIPSL